MFIDEVVAEETDPVNGIGSYGFINEVGAEADPVVEV